MPESTESQEDKKLEDKTAADAAEERVEKLAGKAAQKASGTEQRYDADHNIFSK